MGMARSVPADPTCRPAEDPTGERTGGREGMSCSHAGEMDGRERRVSTLAGGGGSTLSDWACLPSHLYCQEIQ